jgi:hypothetical protein
MGFVDDVKSGQLIRQDLAKVSLMGVNQKVQRQLRLQITRFEFESRVSCLQRTRGGMTLAFLSGNASLSDLDEGLCTVAADDGEKGIPIRLLESRRKTNLILVGDGWIDVARDEEMVKSPAYSVV